MTFTWNSQAAILPMYCLDLCRPVFMLIYLPNRCYCLSLCRQVFMLIYLPNRCYCLCLCGPVFMLNYFPKWCYCLCLCWPVFKFICLHNRCYCLGLRGPVFGHSKGKDADFPSPVQECPGLLPTDLPTGRDCSGAVRRDCSSPRGQHGRKLCSVPLLWTVSEGHHGSTREERCRSSYPHRERALWEWGCILLRFYFNTHRAGQMSTAGHEGNGISRKVGRWTRKIEIVSVSSQDFKKKIVSNWCH